MKSLFVLTSNSKLGDTGRKTGYHLAETTHVHHVLSEAGYEIDFASIEGGEAPIAPDCLDLNDQYNQKFLANIELSRKIKQTTKIEDVNHADYHAIYIPGGYGAMWDLCDNPHLQRIITAIYENGGIVAAVCHGQGALLNVELNDGNYFVKNKNVTSFTDDEE